MYKGWLQKIKTENIMNFDQRVGRSRSQITIFNRAEIMARGYNEVNKTIFFCFFTTKVKFRVNLF